LHVVALVHAYLPHHLAGSERMMQELLAALIARGHTATVLTTTQQLEPYTFEGVTVRPDSPEARADAKPDLIVSHHNASAAAGQWARERRTPLIYVLNDDFPGNVTAARRYSPRLVVANTRWLARSLSHITAPKIIVHPRIRPERHRTTTGAKVTLVNLSDNKGANVFYALAERMPEQQFLGIIGVYGRQDVREMPNVEIREPTADPRTIWQDTAVLLMPSRYESFGMVGVEAAVNGIPTIATPTPGLLESLSYAGTFVDRADIDGWKVALDNLLGPARGPASELARQRARELDSDQEINAWVEAVERIVGAG